MNKKFVAVNTALLCVLVAGCSWTSYDRREIYLDSKTIKRTEVPETLDAPEFEDALEIPAVQDPRNISGQRIELGLPEALSSSFGVDMVVIKRLNDERWVFVDAAPALVWPRVRQFWEDNGMQLETADPSRGLMESSWMTASGADAKEVLESLKAGGSSARDAMRHKFRVRVEAGVRSGSTEIYVEEKELSLDASVSESDVDWNRGSDNNDLEGELLSSVAFYLGDRITREQVISIAATGITGTKAELVPDRLKPVLKYHLAFDRAWATVGLALQNARISVEDLDRSSAIYYVHYDESGNDEPGFFGRLFSGDEAKREVSSVNRYLVHLDSKDDEVHVTVMKDEATFADAPVAEKLLKIIKQFST